MTDVDERLVFMLEARIAEFERRMISAEKRGTKTYNSLQRNSRAATAQMERDALASSARINSALASVSATIGDFAKGFAVGLIGGGLAGFTMQVQSAVSAMADLGAEAKRAGVEVEEFQRWKYVAEQNKIGIDSLTDGFKELSLRADEFVTTGAGSAKEAFERLGFSAAELAIALKDPSALFLEIIGRLEGFDRAAQIRIADEIFGGTGGEKFVQLLDQGAAKIGETKAQADALGLVLEQDLIAKATEIDRKFARWSATIGNGFKAAIVHAMEFFGVIEMSITDANQDTWLLTISMDKVAKSLREWGNTGAADALDQVRASVVNLALDFRQGNITAGEYQIGLADVLTRAQDAIEGMEGLGAAELGGVMNEIEDLLALLGELPPAANEAAGAVARIGGSVDDVTQYGKPPAGGGAPATPARRVGGGGGGNARLETLLRDLQTEKEAVTAWHTESLALLQSASEAQLAAYGGRHGAIERLEQEHQTRLAAIQGAGGANALQTAGDIFGGLAAITAGGNNKLLRLNRVFAAGQALINVYLAQSQVLANPALMPWQKIPAMLQIGAAGFGLVRAINSGGGAAAGVSRASGAAAGSSSTATTSSTAAASAAPLRVTMATIDPRGIFTGQALIDLFNDLQSEAGQRGVVWEFRP